METWALQDAKNKFSAVAETAWRGNPQIVTRHGKPLVVVISYEMFQRDIQHRAPGNIWDAFRKCPVDVDLDSLLPPREDNPGRVHEEDFHEVFA